MEATRVLRSTMFAPMRVKPAVASVISTPGP